MRLRNLAVFVALISTLPGQSIETAAVKSAVVSRQVRVPGEIAPFLQVDLRARVSGYVESVEVDRGSVVRKGQLLVRLSAPELAAQISEAEAKAQAAAAQRAEAEAKYLSLQSTFERLKEASRTPGAIAGNELVVAGKQAEAAAASIKALESAANAARAAVAPLREMQGYLEIKAPFEGVITERLIHPGALASPASGPLLRLEQHSRLRLIATVPEAAVGAIPRGGAVQFRVAAYPGQAFTGTIARVPGSLDPKTRTMPIEIDVANPNGALAPGMYAEIDWPSRRARPSLLVPPTAVATTTERTFVIRVRDGKAEWVNVSKGVPSGELLEVFGPLKEGDVIVKRASDEIREGAPIVARPN